MKKVFITLLVLFSVGFVGFAEPTNGRKLTEEELVPTFDLSMTMVGFSRESIAWAGGFNWWKNAIKKVDKNGYLRSRVTVLTEQRTEPYYTTNAIHWPAK